jgi:hypothetical protein
MTVGNGGRTLYPICTEYRTAGKYFFLENKNYGFALVTVTADKFKVQLKGVENGKAFDMFTVEL